MHPVCTRVVPEPYFMERTIPTPLHIMLLGESQQRVARTRPLRVFLRLILLSSLAFSLGFEECTFCFGAASGLELCFRHGAEKRVDRDP